MEYLHSTDTIIACSTGGTTNSAIAVIRISGTDFLDEVSPFFSLNFSKLKTRFAHYCNIEFDNRIYDEIILTFFEGPNSYNGEDILELAVHGSVVNVNRLINLFIKNSSIRKAYPGEFTYRALRNKKLSLSQVEGLDLLLNANSQFALDQGFSLLSGDLQSKYKNLHNTFLKHKSSLELGFDFLEDIGEDNFQAGLNSSFNDLKSAILKLKKQISANAHNLVKPEITLVGLPNAGKSSLFNLLLDNDRAIVSSVAGTTRDYITEDIFIKDNIFTLVDTAGIRNSDDQIEQAGIGKAFQLINSSFYKILLINPFDINSSFINEIKEINFDLIIFSHSDLKGFKSRVDECRSILSEYFTLSSAPIEPTNSGPIEPSNSGPIEPTNSGPIEPSNSGPIEPSNSGPIEPSNSGPIEPSNSGPIEPIKSGPIEPTNSDHTEPGTIEYVYTSLASKDYLFNEAVESLVFSKLLKLQSNEPILLDRHSDLLTKIVNILVDYEKIMAETQDLSIISSELNIMGTSITELIGIISPDDVLNNIFDNFCIGK